jgi:hypothetical protein
MDNPKTSMRSNTEKDPEDWISGDKPMTGAQASYLKTLCEQAHRSHDFHEHLTKAEASNARVLPFAGNDGSWRKANLHLRPAV